MATLRTVTVDPDDVGADYASLNTAESNEQGNISTATGTDEYVEFECTAISGTVDDTAVSFDGWTTDSTGYIEILTPIASRHNGTWDTSKYRHDLSVGTFYIYEGYVRVTGLQIGTSVSGACLFFRDEGGLNRTSHCLFNGHDVSTTFFYISAKNAATTLEFYNNIGYGSSNVSWWVNDIDVTAYIYNNISQAANYAARNTAGTVTIKNNISLNTGNGYYGTFQSGSRNNIITAAGYDKGCFGVTRSTGTADQNTANHLIDSGATFQTDGVVVGSYVANTTDSQYRYVTEVNSQTDLTIATDLFPDGDENYTIYTNLFNNSYLEFQDESSDNYLLDPKDDFALLGGHNLYTDSNLAITDDILGNSRGSSSTDFFDIGAHHSLKFTKVVDPASGTGYDYTTLESFNSNEQADLTDVGLNKIAEAECILSSGTTPDTSDGEIGGWTTNVTGFVRAITPEAYRHPGYLSTSHYRISGSLPNQITIDEINTEVIGLQVLNSGTNACIRIYWGHTDVKISHCLLEKTTAGNGLSFHNSAITVDIFNTIIYATSTFGAGIVCPSGADTVRIYNCTIEGFSSGIGGPGISYIVKNTVIQNVSSVFSGSYDSSCTHNVQEQSVQEGAFGATHKIGTVTSYTADKLNDSGGGLSVAQVGSIVKDTTDNTYAYVTAVDSDTVLSLSDGIFAGTENYSIYTNMYGSVDFNNETGDDFTLDPKDDVALLKGTNLYTDSSNPVIDDILGNSRGSTLTDHFDVGAHHSLEYEKIVDTGGTGDYTTITAYESNEQGDYTITGMYKQPTATCKNSNDGADTSFTVNAWTLDTTNYLKIWTDPTDVYRHQGSWDTNYFHLSESIGNAEMIRIDESYVRIIGLQVHSTSTASGTKGIQIVADATNGIISGIYISHNIIRDTPSSYDVQQGLRLAGNTSTWYIEDSMVYNNIIYDWTGTSLAYGINDNCYDTAYIHNNTIFNCRTGLYKASGTLSAKNNLVNNCTTDLSDLTSGEYTWGIVDSASSATHTAGSTIASGDTTATTSGHLIDTTTGDFINDGVKVGMVIRDYTGAAFTYVTEVNSATDLSVYNDIFVSGDTYSVRNVFVSDVLFNNENGDDFSLDPKEPIALFNGLNIYDDSTLPVTDDITGVNRGGAYSSWDIGAFYAPSYIRVVDPDGTGDYTSLYNYEANEQEDLTDEGLYKAALAECISSAGTRDTSGQGNDVVFDGWTTASDQYIQVYTPEASRHEGYFDSDKYYMHSDAWYGAAYGIQIKENYFKVTGIQIVADGSDAQGTNRRVVGVEAYQLSSGLVEISHCLIKGQNLGTYPDLGGHGVFLSNYAVSTAEHKVWNNIIYDMDGVGTLNCGILAPTDTNGVDNYIYDNTIYNCNYGIYVNGSGTVKVTIKNNLVHDCTDSFYTVSTWNSNSTHNVQNQSAAEGTIGSTHSTGTATSYTANKLNDSGGGLSDAQIGSIVKNTTDTSYGHVTAVDSDTVLSLNTDVFDTGNEGYEVYTNMYGETEFENEGSDIFLLSSYDNASILKGINLFADSNLSVTDDILGHNRGSSSTDFFDVGAHRTFDYIRIVDPDSGTGYDYTNLSSWESNEQADLRSGGIWKISIAEFTASSGGNDDNNEPDIDGWTTEDTHYIHIRPKPGSEHSGYYDSSLYVKRNRGGAGDGVNIAEDYTILEGMQVEGYLDNLGTFSLVHVYRANSCTIKNCILFSSVSSYNSHSILLNINLNNATHKAYIYNNIIYDCYVTGLVVQWGTEPDGAYIYNNTIFNCDEYCINPGGIFVALKNNIFNDAGIAPIYTRTMNSDNTHNVVNGTITAGNGAFGATHQTGTATSYTASKLNDSGGGFTGTPINSIVANTTDSSYAYVTAVDSDTVLSLSSNAFDTGNENYSIYTNMYGDVTFQNEGSDIFLLGSGDTVAKDKGTDLSNDPDLPITDDILGNTRT